ncbi:MAG TPA: hypothetical protein VD861_09300, partial [Pyrinomonadaceae bacterium]|nr:hypothetical protein [Pyrinomonadaceae bacterium]
MNRRQLSHRLLCLLVSLLFIAQSAAATPNGEGAEGAERKIASLSVRLDSKGSALVFLNWGSAEPFPPAIEQKLGEALGVRLEKFRPAGVEDYEGYEEEMAEEGEWPTFYGRAENAFSGGGLLVSGRVDLAPLVRELRASGVTYLSVMLMLPQSSGFTHVTGASPCNPQMQYFICS